MRERLAESMKIVVFGVNGATGRLLIEQALGRGHAVTAVTRRPKQSGMQHEGLIVVHGDVYDQPFLDAAIAWQDAVISVVGAPFSWKEIMVHSQSATAIVQGMQTEGVQRLLVTTSGGTHPNGDPNGRRTARTDVADFMLNNITNDETVRKGYAIASVLS